MPENIKQSLVRVPVSIYYQIDWDRETDTFVQNGKMFSPILISKRHYKQISQNQSYPDMLLTQSTANPEGGILINSEEGVGR